MLSALALAILILLSCQGCQTPCDQLADRLCQLAKDDTEQCERWQDRAKRVKTETCEAGLRELDRDRVR